jgi:alkylation response protein AidB-like acyl-CoA dehydrogenase
MTGDAEFNEVFFSEVRIPDSARVGLVGEGWAVATTTLMNERVALSGAGNVAPEAGGGGPVDALVGVARRLGRWEDPVLRQRLVEALIDSRVLRFNNFRSAAARRAGRQPGPEGSITKLFAAEHNQNVQDLAVEILGAGGMAWTSSNQEAASMVRGFLRSRANTIEGGTSEIMRNILAERVLGLPKEPSADRDVPWKDIPRSK